MGNLKDGDLVIFSKAGRNCHIHLAKYFDRLLRVTITYHNVNFKFFQVEDYETGVMLNNVDWWIEKHLRKATFNDIKRYRENKRND